MAAEPYYSVTLRVKVPLYQKLEEYAKKNGVPMSKLLISWAESKIKELAKE